MLQNVLFQNLTVINVSCRANLIKYGNLEDDQSFNSFENVKINHMKTLSVDINRGNFRWQRWGSN